ncbi:hypothetical protein FQR65_LT14501 [Abscondita terminalis]|nr:hypothetical protein FQR65_LT14501 [Abscondita terminalis]
MNFLGLSKIGEFFRIVKQTGGIRASLYKMFRMDELKVGTLMGTDECGNKYYENNRFFYGRNRWVEYAPHYRLEYDGSQVSAEWFGWLHYKTDLIPSQDPGRPKYKWMAGHTENLSGTPCQYVPYSTTRPKIEPWIPETKFSRLSHHQAGYTHFGFEDVKEEEKAERVRKVFEDVAAMYDTMNDTMSFGLHRIWKDVFMHRLGPTSGTKLLDVAGGTGDIAFRFINYVVSGKCQDDCHVTVLDINPSMLNVGKSRRDAGGFDSTLISFEEGDAERLPYEDNSFNAYTIAFGIRNCTNIDRVLSEAYRVLRPGGRFLCLEFSHLNEPTLQWIYDQYSFQIIPLLGQLIAGQWYAYQYLVESIRRFPNQVEFQNMIESSGFRQVTFENLTSGVVAIHSGFKL